MNPLTSQFFHTVLIHDNSFTDHSHQLKSLINFLKPDNVITSLPVSNLESYNSTNLQSTNLFQDIYVTNDNCTDLNKNLKYIKLTRDITHRFHDVTNTYLLIGIGAEYKNFIEQNKQWFGKYQNKPWVVTHYEASDISFCLLYINKQTGEIHSGTHCFDAYFWSENCAHNSPHSIFARDFDDTQATPDLSVLSHK